MDRCWSCLMQNLRIMALTPSILGHAYCGMVFPSLLNIENTSLNWKENLKNREILTVLVFYVDEVINKIFIVFLLVLISICYL